MSAAALTVTNAAIADLQGKLCEASRLAALLANSCDESATVGKFRQVPLVAALSNIDALILEALGLADTVEQLVVHGAPDKAASLEVLS